MFDVGARVYNKSENDRSDVGEVLDSYRDDGGNEFVKVRWESERLIPGSLFTRPDEEWVISSKLGLLLPGEG